MSYQATIYRILPSAPNDIIQEIERSPRRSKVQILNYNFEDNKLNLNDKKEKRRQKHLIPLYGVMTLPATERIA